MSASTTIAQGLHSIAENVPACGLDDIFHEFRTVRFKPLPFFRSSDTFIGNAVATEFVFTDARLHIGKTPAGRKGDKEHSALTRKMDLFDVLICKKWRKLEFIPGEFQIGISPCATVVFCLAEGAPFAAEVVSVTSKGKFCGRFQDFVGPAVKVIFGKLVGADVAAAWLIDGHSNGVDVVDS